MNIFSEALAEIWAKYQTSIPRVVVKDGVWTVEQIMYSTSYGGQYGDYVVFTPKYDEYQETLLLRSKTVFCSDDAFAANPIDSTSWARKIQFIAALKLALLAQPEIGEKMHAELREALKNLIA